MRTRTGRGSGAGPHVYTYISRTRVFQDLGPLGTFFLTMPADLGHMWLFAVSIEWVKMAPELVVFLFLWVLCRAKVKVRMTIVESGWNV